MIYDYLGYGMEYIECVEVVRYRGSSGVEARMCGFQMRVGPHKQKSVWGRPGPTGASHVEISLSLSLSLYIYLYMNEISDQCLMHSSKSKKLLNINIYIYIINKNYTSI